MPDGSPSLVLVERPAQRSVVLRPARGGWKAFVHEVAISTGVWVTNQHQTDDLIVVETRIRDCVLSDVKTSTWNGIGSIVSAGPAGESGPPTVPPGVTVELTCRYSMPAHRQKDGDKLTWVNPKTVEGTIVLTDQYGTDYEVGPLRFR
jgi:hypothetical protein